jgi:alkenylglycerophosphocholine hydrolase
MSIREGRVIIWLILAFVFAALEAWALSKNLHKLEYVAKPAVMVCLFVWLYFSTGLQGNTFWFGLGLLFSLAGDVLLMISLDRMFLPGLAAFLLAHLSYIIGFRDEITTITAWSLILAVVIFINVVRIIRRIVGAMRAKGENRLVNPVIFYALTISVMLYAAMSTISNPAWKTSAAFFVSAGAFLFCASDVILAWNKFVAPVKNGRILNIATYHLGQIGLIAGVISQFG